MWDSEEALETFIWGLFLVSWLCCQDSEPQKGLRSWTKWDLNPPLGFRLWLKKQTVWPIVSKLYQVVIHLMFTVHSWPYPPLQSMQRGLKERFHAYWQVSLRSLRFSSLHFLEWECYFVVTQYIRLCLSNRSVITTETQGVPSFLRCKQDFSPGSVSLQSFATPIFKSCFMVWFVNSDPSLY